LLVKAFVDGYEVIDSGVIHLTGTTVEFVVDGLPIEVLFKIENLPPKYAVTIEGYKVVLTLSDFSSKEGQGLIEPLVVASSQGRDIKMTFFVQTLPDSHYRIMSYAFLLAPNLNG
jgi:hypothetical protein